MLLAACEKTVFALDPMSRIVPTTMTRIIANITAYSAISWPSSFVQSVRMSEYIDASLEAGGLLWVENFRRHEADYPRFSSRLIWLQTEVSDVDHRAELLKSSTACPQGAGEKLIFTVDSTSTACPLSRKGRYFHCFTASMAEEASNGSPPCGSTL